MKGKNYVMFENVVYNTPCITTKIKMSLHSQPNVRGDMMVKLEILSMFQ